MPDHLLSWSRNASFEGVSNQLDRHQAENLSPENSIAPQAKDTSNAHCYYLKSMLEASLDTIERDTAQSYSYPS